MTANACLDHRTVVSSPHEGAYELAVDEVFRGSVDSIVLIGLEEPSDVPQLCSQLLEMGDRVLVGPMGSVHPRPLQLRGAAITGNGPAPAKRVAG